MMGGGHITESKKIVWKYERGLLDTVEDEIDKEYKKICTYNLRGKCFHVYLPTFGTECDKEFAEKCEYRTTKRHKDFFRERLLYGW